MHCHRATSTQSGQSSIEYILVLALAVVVLTAGNDPPLAKLAAAVRDYFGHYSYAMSFAQPPDCVQDKTIGGSGPGGASASASATVDTCPDITNPSWPIDFHEVNITPPSVP
jgi:hypothetical protein